MKNAVSLFFVGAAMLLFVSVSSAQDAPWHIVSLSGDTLTAVSLDSLHDDQLFATGNSGAFAIPLDSVATIQEHKEGHFWTGAAIGSGAGAAIGAVAGAASYQKPQSGLGFDVAPDFGWGFSVVAGGAVGALGGFVVGGIIGGATAHDVTFDLSGMKPNVRIQVVRNLLSE